MRGWDVILAGIDEAGYGPLLGPLVVSATAFEVEGEVPEEVEGVPCLWRLMKAGVAKKHAGSKGRVVVADSKVIHNLADGNRLLERGVLAFLKARGEEEGTCAGNLAELLGELACKDHGLDGHAWYRTQEIGVPWLVEAGDLAIASNVLAGAMRAGKVKLVAVRTAVLSEGVFNKLVTGTNNKGAALVSITLRHLYQLHQQFGERGLMVTIDKQGGRDHYTSLLLKSFPEATLRVLKESSGESVYVLVEGGRRTTIVFREKSEASSLPTALASMTCKYLRELCMHGFNGWWCERVAGLRPTAGYYQDGMRWLMDVEPHLAKLGVTREMLCRVK